MYRAGPGDPGFRVNHAAGSEAGTSDNPANGIKETVPMALDLAVGVNCAVCREGVRQHSLWVHPEGTAVKSIAPLQWARA